MQKAYLALGANLADPQAQLAEATDRLHSDDVSVVLRSRLYRSAPVGPPGQSDYLNAVVEIRTRLAPAALLTYTQGIEQAMGRVKTVRWGPRLVDIDIAVYATWVVRTQNLTIPHRELGNRRFVLAPLADLAPELIVPGTGQTVVALMAALQDSPDDISVLRDAW